MKLSTSIQALSAACLITFTASMSAHADGTNTFLYKSKEKYAENKELIDGIATGFKEATKIYKEVSATRAASAQAARDWEYKMKMLELEERKIRALEKLANLRDLGLAD